MSNENLYKNIPSVNKILEDPEVKKIVISREIKTTIVRQELQKIRKEITKGKNFSYDSIMSQVTQKIKSKLECSLRRVINATGIILHTGLGRAPIPYYILQELPEYLKGYINLEVDSSSGIRSKRDFHFKEILSLLTGAEDCTIVNNNAAAVLLTISSIAKGKEVIISAGQLVEIGGSFRIPEIIEESGAHLRIVGCTNKTHLKDYEQAINSETAAILHVHTSNYKVIGFTDTPSLQQLQSLAKKYKIPLIDDAGSGALIDLAKWQLDGEPLIQNSISMGADVVTFSGDKILGGCQAGIVIGKQDLIKKIRSHPLYRAFRPDKMTLFVLEKVLRLYLDSDALEKHNPTLKMLKEDPETTKIRAQKIYDAVKNNGSYSVEIEYFPSYTGSGALPAVQIPSYAVVLQSKNSTSVANLAQRLRDYKPVVFTVTKNDALYICPRTLLGGECEELISILKKIL